MASTTTMTVRVSSEVKDKLEKIANHTRRSKSFLAGEAIAVYVDRELEIIEGITRSLADVKAGRLTPHQQVTLEARQIIAEAKKKHKKAPRG